jgi:hypothetical protein
MNVELMLRKGIKQLEVRNYFHHAEFIETLPIIPYYKRKSEETFQKNKQPYAQ